LYLYSEDTVDEHCMKFLGQICGPLFEYVAYEYGPPRQLNGRRCLEFLPNQPSLFAKNWVYDDPKEFDLKGTSVYKHLSSLIKQVPGVKSGYTCRLKVSIPARETHPFWALDPGKVAEYKLYVWDMVEEALEFEVCLWGLDDDRAKFNGTCHAKDIIRSIRTRVKSLQSSTGYSQEIEIEHEMLHPSKQKEKCEILNIGKLLNVMWINASDAFNFITITKERSFASFGYKQILSLSSTSPLLRYYSVFSFLICVDK
jgi:hypothetical protein